MILILKDGATTKEIEAIEKKLFPETVNIGFDAKKYNGRIRMKEDPIITQGKLRTEWERD
ncbi:hypothetical protein [Mucilaginibacter dorajii]|uniref:Uncharacterized protein n=1 Tax=Mucilaginibacter dorajii TaxID=692994 RepID=A0ABP7PVI1_9SPHI|nr:hypothetical protein [Mucilaginibacter dorajii]MCS3734997.1 hypothetical protein [Mucilaginibacter dorajii]